MGGAGGAGEGFLHTVLHKTDCLDEPLTNPMHAQSLAHNRAMPTAKSNESSRLMLAWHFMPHAGTRTAASHGKSTVVVSAAYMSDLVAAVRKACRLNDSDDAVATLASRFPEELPRPRYLKDGARTIHMEVQRNQHGTFMRMYQRVQVSKAVSE